MAAAEGAGLPYREVLRPTIWVWLMPIGFASFLGVAYGYAYGASAGWLVGALCAAVLLAAMATIMRTRIEVDSHQVRAGRAQLPTQFVGRVKPLTAAESFTARTSGADPRAHLVLSPWASATTVIMEVTDPADPHPYWLISTRRPQHLAQALQAARDEPGSR